MPSFHSLMHGSSRRQAHGPCSLHDFVLPILISAEYFSIYKVKMTSLDSLPVDVQYNILSWLICPLVGHPIARSPQSQEELYSAELYKLVAPRYASSNKFTGNHPYLCLAASSRTLRATLEDYCHHLVMKRLATCIKAKRIITPKYKDWSADVAKAATNGNEVPVGNTRTYRLQYLKWAYENCLFCGKKSSRRAIFNLHMWCCKHCDKAQWGEKVVCSPSLMIRLLKMLTTCVSVEERGAKQIQA